MNKTLPLLTLALATAIAGCTSISPKVPDGYPKLTIKANDANTLVFAKPNLRLGQYSKAFIAPVHVQMEDEQGTTDVTDAEAAQIAEYTQKRLNEQMAKYLVLVREPGPDVLTVRFMITDLQPTSKAQIMMLVPPFSMINMISPKGAFHGSVTLAGELYEGLSTEASVAFVATRSRPGIDASVAFSRWAVAEKVIDNAAERLTEDLAKERGAGN